MELIIILCPLLQFAKGLITDRDWVDSPYQAFCKYS